MQVKNIAECSHFEWEHSAILLTFIKLPLKYVIKIFVLFIFEWPFFTGFTVIYASSLSLLIFASLNSDKFGH